MVPIDWEYMAKVCIACVEEHHRCICMYTPCTLLAFTIVAIDFTDELMTASCGIEVGHQLGL